MASDNGFSTFDGFFSLEHINEFTDKSWRNNNRNDLKNIFYIIFFRENKNMPENFLESKIGCFLWGWPWPGGNGWPDLAGQVLTLKSIERRSWWQTLEILRFAIVLALDGRSLTLIKITQRLEVHRSWGRGSLLAFKEILWRFRLIKISFLVPKSLFWKFFWLLHIFYVDTSKCPLAIRYHVSCYLFFFQWRQEVDIWRCVKIFRQQKFSEGTTRDHKTPNIYFKKWL